MVVMLIVVLISQTFAVVKETSIAWSDDFDDGDFASWTVVDGSFEVDSSSKKRLHALDEYNMIYHSSEQTNGSWMFDVFENGTNAADISVIFMVNGLDSYDWYGYALTIRYIEYTDSIGISRLNYSDYFNQTAWYKLAGYDIEDPDYVGLTAATRNLDKVGHLSNAGLSSSVGP